MRKVLISLLLASAAASPALADRPDWSDRQAARAERQESRADRQSSHEDRSSSSSQSSSYSRPERTEQRSFEPRQTFEPRQSYQPQQYQPEHAERREPANLGNAGPVERSVEAYRQRQQGFQAGREQRVEQRAERLQQLRDYRDLR